jgi:Chain length determinant protein
MTTDNIPLTVNSQLTTDSDEISLKELIEKLQHIWKFLLSKWKLIVLAGMIGGLIGFVYAYMQPVKYTAKMTFVVEDAKGGGGGLASLAGQFGFDIGGGGGGSIFSGDNILLFLKSESLVRETLLTPLDEKSGTTLADRYAEVNKLKESWSKNEKIGEINFTKYKIDNIPRKEDSLLQNIESGIIKNELAIAKADKKASFIEAKSTSLDEAFSKIFLDRLVKVATERYVDSKTKTKAANVAMLQRRADSLSAVLNNKTYSAAASQQSLVDANPALKTSAINSEITTRDKTMAATVFAEVVKNLELSKTLLNQETPVIQIVDQSTFPLEKEKTSKLKSSMLGAFLAGFLTILYLIASKWVKSQLAF